MLRLRTVWPVVVALLLLLVTRDARAQTLNSTTLTANATATATTLTVASTATMAPGHLVFVDREAATVVTVASATSLTVTRSYAGLNSAHGNGSTVYSGPPTSFYRDAPASPTCVASQSANPYINLDTGVVWACTVSGTWAQMGPSAPTGLFLMGNGTGAPWSFTSAPTAGTSITSPFFQLVGGTIFNGATDGIGLLTNAAGTNFTRLQFGGTTASFPAIKRNGTALNIRLADDSADAGITASTAALSGTVTSYNGVATTGWGLPAIQAAARATAQTAANASVATYTVGAADGSFEVSANVLVTTATTHNFTVQCTYTDEGSTARTITFSFEQLAGSLTTAVVNTNGTVPYEGVPLHIRAKAATAITILTQAAGTYTSVVYNVEGVIRQIM